MTAPLVPGERRPLPTVSTTITVRLDLPGADVCAFVLDARERLLGDAYLVFYNNDATPDRLVRQIAPDRFVLDLERLPPAVGRIAFAASHDARPFADLRSGDVTVEGGGQSAVLPLGGVFGAEKAVILLEVYRKDVGWRVQAVAQGFRGGLADLVRHYGGNVSAAPAPVAPTAPAPPAPPRPAPVPPAVAPPPAAPSVPSAAPSGGAGGVRLDKREKLLSLDKKIEREAPHLLSLVKTAQLSLEKKGLLGHTAKVALCLDISGSMHRLYEDGRVQALAEKALALGTRFDDDGNIDVFLFGHGAHDVGEMRIEESRGYVGRLMKARPLEGATYYARAVRLILKHYYPDHRPGRPTRDDCPVYVIFVTDGEASDRAEAEKAIREASDAPIFWSFVGIGQSRRTAETLLGSASAPPTPVPPTGPPPKTGWLGRLLGAPAGGAGGRTDFAFLEALDDLPGRFIDNAGFFSVPDPAAIDDAVLFDLLMHEYPRYVELARSRGLLGP